MRWVLNVLRGFRGHPAHPPLTDVTVGAFTVNAVAVVCGLIGFQEARMLDLAFLSAVVTLVAAALTILTGLVDYVRIPRGSSMRRTASLHWVVQVSSTSVLLVATALLQPGSNDGQMPLVGAVLALAAWLLMAFGAWVGGALVTVHGMRVLNEPDAPTRDAISPHFPPD